MNKAEHLKWNEGMARKYDIDNFHTRTNIFIRQIENARIGAVVGAIAPKPGERILEVGCGSGKVLENFENGSLHGIDISRELLSKARKKFGRKVVLKYGDAEAIPFPSNYFDKICCTEVLEHLRNPGKAISEMRRVGRPGSLAAITIPNEHMIDDAKAIARKLGMGFLLKNVASEKNEWHIHYFDEKKLLGLAKGKMELLSLRGLPMGFLPLHYIAVFRITK
ncbi:MAG: methyltransferase domain-containing protein [Candidatus Micrarchaeota archaeon]